MNTNKKAANPCKGKAAQQKHHTAYHSPIDSFLSRLDGVKRTGNGTWLVRCPAHADKSPSLSIRETDDGKVLIHCYAGCSVHEVVSAVGLEISDLFPPRPVDHTHVGKPERRPFPCADTLRAIAFEATIVALAGAAIIAGEPITQFDKNRLLVAVGRINDALDASGVSHHG